ncbi:MAG: thiamine phosphate synthase [Rhodospirillaceae bacterium]|nr:thiamine phosphate synthase [Rhodospirillaceae bacterium]|tara:strand:+ start:25470 stop:26135 length:666 start_codon:yes stop_codon:yes gene_type:complete
MAGDDDRLRCRLYLITPPDIGGDALTPFADSLANALDGGDVACLQLRLKDVDDDVILEAAGRLRPICHEKDVAFIMNDRADLAAKADCDGVHVGQTDTPYAEARELLGDDAIIGVTCHASTHLAMEAGDAGADYVAFGAFFDSTTKHRKHFAEPALLTQWQETMLVPCVAIGGITIKNCSSIVEAGADFVAVAAGVWTHPDGPGAAVKAYNEIFDEVAGDR